MLDTVHIETMPGHLITAAGTTDTAAGTTLTAARTADNGAHVTLHGDPDGAAVAAALAAKQPFWLDLSVVDADTVALQDDILRRPTDAQLGRLFDLKRHLITIRRLSVEWGGSVTARTSGAAWTAGVEASLVSSW